MDTLREQCDEMSGEIKEIREAHRQFVAYMAEQLAALNSRIGHLEGRSDGLKAELTATLQVEILKASQKNYLFRRKPGALPPAGDSDLE